MPKGIGISSAQKILITGTYSYQKVNFGGQDLPNAGDADIFVVEFSQ